MQAARVNEVVLRVYDSFEAVQSRKDEWDELALQVNGDAFNTFEWCKVWWKHFGTGRELRIYWVEQRARAIAVIPLFYERMQLGPVQLGVVKLVGSDHTNTTCSPLVCEEHFETAIGAVTRDLREQCKVDIFHFGELPGYWGRTRELADALATCLGDYRIVHNSRYYPQMLIPVPESYEAFMASLSRQERHNVRYARRQLEREGQVREVEPETPGELQASLAQMIEMHQAQWTGAGWAGHFGDWPGIREFYVDIVEAFQRSRALIMREVRVRGECVASELCVHFAGRAHWLVGGRRERVPGRVGFCAVLRSALERKLSQIDAMMGYYEYKRRLGARLAYVQTVTAISSALDSRLRWRIAQAVTWWRLFWYYKIWYWRIVPRIRKCCKRHPEMLRKTLSRKFLRSRFLVGAGAARECRSEQT